MTSRAARHGGMLSVALAVWLSSPTGLASAQDGDMVLSGKLNHGGVYDVAGDADSTIELSAARYVFEVPPALVGAVQPLDMELMNALCRDLEGCRITLAMVNWSTFDAPGGVRSRTSRLFLSESSAYYRFDESLALWGVDGDAITKDWVLEDCLFTDGENLTGENGHIDAGVGFGLLNCKNLDSSGCFQSDATTTCRVVIED